MQVIRGEVLKEVVNNYIDEVFEGFTFDTLNVINKVGVKIKMDQYFDRIVQALGNEQGIINVSRIEEYALPEVRRLGIITVPGFMKSYTFKEDDVLKLLAKIKEKSTNEA